jgi:hypothetical protein
MGFSFLPTSDWDMFLPGLVVHTGKYRMPKKGKMKLFFVPPGGILICST